MKPERHIAHLEYRASGYFWRRRIPRKISGKTNLHIRLSLKTRSAITATWLAERLNVLSDLLLEAAVVADMTPTEVHTLVTETLAREVSAADQKRALAPRRSELEAREEDAQVEALLGQLRSALRLRDYSLAENAMRATASSLGLPVDEAAPEWRAAAFETMRGLLDVTEDRARRDRGVFDEPSPFFQSARRKASSVPAAIPVTPSQAVNDLAIAQPATLASTPVAQSAVEVAPSLTLTPQIASRVPAPPAAPDPSPAPALSKGASAPWATFTMGKIAADQNVNSPSNEHSRPRAADQKTGKSPLLGEVIKQFLNHIGAGHSHRRVRPSPSPGKKSKKQMENLSATMKKVSAILGDVPIASVTESDLSDMFELLHDMPTNFTRSKPLRTQFENGTLDLVKYIEASLAKEEVDQAELAKALEAQGESPRNIEEKVAKQRVKRYSAQTIYRIMQEVKRLFEHARLKGWIVLNPMDEVIWTTKEAECAIANEGNKKRKPWFAKLDQFLRLPLFTEPLQDVGDPMFWASLIALNTGMRLEEICQLNVEDFECYRGIHYMNVRSTDTQSAKTESSVRIVPLNQNLVKLGLLKLVELRRSQNELALFPNLKRNCRGILSAKVSNTFRRMNMSAGLYEARLDFHSFRMTVNQFLIGLRVAEEVRCTLLGHVLTGTNHKHYTEGFPLDQLHEAVELINFDMSSVLDPFAAVAGDHKVTSLANARARKVLDSKSA